MYVFVSMWLYQPFYFGEILAMLVDLHLFVTMVFSSMC